MLIAFDVTAQPTPIVGCTLAFANPFLADISDGPAGLFTMSDALRTMIGQ